jgi:hypothetical protein
MEIKFSTDNDAFYEKGRAQECYDILGEIRKRIDSGQTSGPVMDSNGNRIGRWSL